MADLTTNYNFTKPDQGTVNWHEPLNNNFDAIDTRIKNNQDSIEVNAASITTLETDLATAQTDIVNLQNSISSSQLDPIEIANEISDLAGNGWIYTGGVGGFDLDNNGSIDANYTVRGNYDTIAAHIAASNPHSVSLDDAYDAGGAGGGRSITANSGAVQILGNDGLVVIASVGIGTTNPQARLHVGDGTNETIVRLQGERNMSISAEGTGATTYFRFNDLSGSKAFQFYDEPNDGVLLHINSNVGTPTIGIGTTSPDAGLHLYSTGTAAIKIESDDPNNGCYLTLDRPNDTRVNVVHWTTNDVVDWTAGTPYNSGNTVTSFSIGTTTNLTDSVFLITTDGDVGVGTTNPDGARLHVYDPDQDLQMRIGYSAGTLNPRVRWSGDNGGSNNQHADIGLDAVNQVFNIYAPHDTSPDTEAISIKDTSDVGIGTTNPVRKVQILGTPTTNGNAQTVLAAWDSSSLAAGVGGGIDFGGTYTAGGERTNFAAIWAEKDNATSGNEAASLKLATRASGGLLTTHMTIASDGNVGIGTTTPDTELHVEGDIKQQIISSDVSNPPTDAELDALFTSPASKGDGWTTYIQDSNSNNLYQIVASGSQWYIFTGVLAA